MPYPLLRNLHISLAIISVGGFVLRWWWMRSGSVLSRHGLNQVLPHMVDTLFLATGIWLAIRIGQYPFVQGWLTAKILGLITYIILGSVALKRGKTPMQKDLSLLAALLVVGWIVSVALTKNPAGFLSFLS